MLQEKMQIYILIYIFKHTYKRIHITLLGGLFGVCVCFMSFGETGANVNQESLISCSSCLNLSVEVLGLQVSATMSISELLNH